MIHAKIIVLIKIDGYIKSDDNPECFYIEKETKILALLEKKSNKSTPVVEVFESIDYSNVRTKITNESPFIFYATMKASSPHCPKYLGYEKLRAHFTFHGVPAQFHGEFQFIKNGQFSTKEDEILDLKAEDSDVKEILNGLRNSAHSET